ncbi:MAG: hypothetical protein AAF762_03230 [Pseudomonadota bacterium]
MTRRSAILGAVLVLATPCLAQERVSPEAFLDAAEGKTLTFEMFPSGSLVGVEEFLRRDLSVWRRAGEDCVYGSVSVRDDQICFAYDDDPEGVEHCWVTFSDGERFFVAMPSEFEADGLEVQVVSSISDETLDCPVKPGV